MHSIASKEVRWRGRAEKEWGMKAKRRQGWQQREGQTSESIKARTTKCASGDERKDRRGSTWWTAGLRSRGSSSGSGRTANVILSSCLVQMQRPKLYPNLTFQKHRVDPTFTPLSSASLRHPSLSSPLCPPPSVLLYPPSLIPATFPQLLIYFFPSHSSRYISLYYSRSSCIVFLMVTLLHFVSLYIRFGWAESKVNRSCLNPSRSPSSSPLPKQTLKPIKGLILFFFVEGDCSRWILYITVTDPLRAASLSSLLLLLLLSVLTAGFAHDWYSSVAKQTKRDKSRLLSVGEIRL